MNLLNRLSSSLEIAWLEVKSKYARSLLGPFWITLSMIILISGLSFVFVSLFGIPIEKTLPWIAIGIIVWNFINTYLDDSCQVFISDKHLNIKMSPIKMIFINIFKNSIIFFHNSIVLIPIIIFTDLKVNFAYFFLIFSFIIIFLNAFSFGILFGFLCCRFRDFYLIIKNILYLLFLMTPIFWMPEVLKGNRMLLADVNILYQIIQMVRDPLLGNIPGSYSIIYVCTFTLFIFIISLFVYKKFKNKVIFWI